MLKAAIFLLLCCTAMGEQFEIIQPTENPHMSSKITDASGDEGVCASGLGGCPALSGLDPVNIISASIATQPDTLLGIVRKRYMGVEVPIYHFRQSARLNPDQLPFKIVRMKAIPMEGVVIVPVEPTAAADSWFVGYSWDIVVCQQCSGWKHLGWRFSSKVDGTSFFALIVDYREGKRREAEGSERIMEALTVGVRAPAWMLALATMTLQAQVSAGKGNK